MEHDKFVQTKHWICENPTNPLGGFDWIREPLEDGKVCEGPPCVYNHTQDPAHDTCIFCGQPEERK